MRLAKVIGNVVSTHKLPVFEGRKLMLVKPCRPDYSLTEEAVVAIDMAGAGPGEIVVLAEEGRAVADLLNNGKRAPARSVIIGIVDKVQDSE